MPAGQWSPKLTIRSTRISTITVFGTPVEITLSELSLEAFYPADEATVATMQAMNRRSK